MTTELPKQAICYGCYDDKTICGFIGVIHFPHPVNKKIKSISRLCVLPDYQGIGIGRRFLNVIAKKYADEGFDVKITTSAKNLIYALRRDKNWIMQRYSANKKPKVKTKNARCSQIANTIRNNCKTASFYFKNG